MSTRTTIITVFILGFICGVLIAYSLTRPPQPPAEKPRRGKTQPIRIVEKPA